ncbi:MAG: 1-acyl-sn-glycerol-3-phosphate acyltransferase [Candidatus Obscuribacterales bacterium]|nr:1-acyl-sn-glycerol-3-phosphate acyltransferase [Candidatus Obscuribacterales bacterium]
MNNFVPPKDNRLMTAMAKMLLPFALDKSGLAVTVTNNCLERMRLVSRQNTVLMVNHSDRFDPVAVFALSKKCREDFYYLAALEQFEENYGISGWFMQQCGAYSVIRGEPADQVSKRTTISVIASGARKLVMFPEGDVSGRDDLIVPLKKDGLENIFAAQEKIVDSARPVYLLPVGLFYEVPSSTLPLLVSSVSNLEKKLFLHHGPLSSLQTRVETLVRAFINHLEAKYGVSPHPERPMAGRLLAICRKEIVGIAETLGMDVGEESEAVLLYSVRSKLRRISTFCNCLYCRQLKKEEKQRADYLKPELDRLQQLLILASTLEQKPFSMEVAWRVLDRLELELNSPTWKGVRRVLVDASDPIDLREFFKDFEKNPQATISEVEHTVQRGLLECLEHAKASRRQRVGVKKS